MSSTQSTTTYKFIVIGSCAVGKTAILRRLINNDFTDVSESTVGAGSESITFDIDDKKVKLQIWDTAGHEKFRTITRTFFRSAAGVILVFDVTTRSTFDDVNFWLNDVHQLCSPDAVIMLVGNKCDLVDERQITINDAEVYSKQHQLKYIETSAKSGENVKEAFLSVATQLYRNGVKSTPVIKMNALPNPHKSGCNC